MASFPRAWWFVTDLPITQEAIFVKSLHQRPLWLIFMPFGNIPTFWTTANGFLNEAVYDKTVEVTVECRRI